MNNCGFWWKNWPRLPPADDIRDVDIQAEIDAVRREHDSRPFSTQYQSLHVTIIPPPPPSAHGRLRPFRSRVTR